MESLFLEFLAAMEGAESSQAVYNQDELIELEHQEIAVNG